MPQLSRRTLLSAPAVLAAGALVPGGFAAALDAETLPMPDLSSWEAIRAQFTLDPRFDHFASFFIASHPAPVRAAIEAWRKALDRDPFQVVEHGMFGTDADNLPLRVQQSIARYFGGRAEDVALARSTTEALALVYHGLPLKAGDEVLATTHDHYSHHEAIRLATSRCGATLRKIPLFEDAATATTSALVERLLAGIGPKTRVVGITWVHSSTGIRLPVRELSSALKAKHPDVRLVVDGVHGLGSTDEEIATLGADYFCAGCHKWMFAPRGTALLWANADNWARLRPLVPTFSELESYTAWTEDRAPAAANNAARMTPGGFHAFEHQWAMGTAFEMHLRMGRARVAGRIAALNTRLKQRLAGEPKIRVHTPAAPELSAGLVSFEVQGIAPLDVVKRLLEQRIIASTSPYAVTYARLAPSLVNTEAQVDRAADAVLRLARG